MQDVTAYHECGHALMALLVGARVQCLTLDPDPDDRPRRTGDTRIIWSLGSTDRRRYHEGALLVCLAGPVAEMIYTNRQDHPAFHPAWRYDWHEAVEHAQSLGGTEVQQRQRLEVGLGRAHALLADDGHWSAVAALADELLAHELLEEEEIRETAGLWLRLTDRDLFEI